MISASIPRAAAPPPQVGPHHRRGGQQRLVHQVSEAGETAPPAGSGGSLPNGRRRKRRSSDWTRRSPARRRRSARSETLRLGVEHERGYDGLRRNAPADDLTRRHRAGRQHQVDVRIRQQRIHRPPRSVDRPVGNPPFLRRQDHREPRARRSAISCANRRCMSSVLSPGPSATMPMTQGAQVICAVVGRAGVANAAGREQDGRNPARHLPSPRSAAPVPEAAPAGGGVPVPAPLTCGTRGDDGPSPAHALHDLQYSRHLAPLDFSSYIVRNNTMTSKAVRVAKRNSWIIGGSS